MAGRPRGPLSDLAEVNGGSLLVAQAGRVMVRSWRP
jgi:hypothetical protein